MQSLPSVSAVLRIFLDGFMDGAIGATLLGGMGTMSLAALVWFTAATKHFIIVEGFDEGDGKCLMS